MVSMDVREKRNMPDRRVLGLPLREGRTRGAKYATCQPSVGCNSRVRHDAAHHTLMGLLGSPRALEINSGPAMTLGRKAFDRRRR